MVTLADNTRRLLQSPRSEEPITETRGNQSTIYCPALIEYEFLSGRELYDGTIISADRHHSSAGEWVVRGQDDFYHVRVASRPVYALPQNLILRFHCYGDPEAIASEYLALLSVYAREPLIPVGVKRNNDVPITVAAAYHYPQRDKRGASIKPVGIDSNEIKQVLEGMGKSDEEDVNAALAAARFYQSALSLVDFDRSTAYVSLVSAIETLAGRHYRDWKPTFDEIQKLTDSFGPILEQFSVLADASDLVARLKTLLAANEHLPTQKFVKFVVEHLPQSFWEIKDDLYEDYSEIFPMVNVADLSKRLKALYSARSHYVHAGEPFPYYVEFGMRETYPASGLAELHDLREQPSFIPPIFWFERVANLVILEYLRRTFATGVWQEAEERRKKKCDLLERIKNLPDQAQDSLRKLAHWTRKWVPFAVIGPMAPNNIWADSAETVEVLRDAGLIRLGSGVGLAGSSYLKNREVGEAVGEFVFGLADNPFRDCQIFLPEELEEDFHREVIPPSG